MLKSKKRIITIAVVALIILLGAILFFRPMHKMDKAPQGGEVPEEVIPEVTLDTDISIGDIIGVDEERIGDTKDIINILLIGQDTRTEKDGMSDSMILCTINKEKKTLVMTSFMRDMYVHLQRNDGTYTQNRINVAYFWGGMPRLNQTLEDNFGVVVDHNIEVDFAAFKDIVDILGGVEIELTALEALKVREGAGNGSKAHEGVNLLNGAEALAYARIRKIDSDFHRTERQRTVMMKVFEKCKSMSFSEAWDLVKVVLPMVTTDMSPADITMYAANILPILSELTVTTQRIPADGTWNGGNVGTAEEPMYVLITDLEANRQILKDTLG